MTHSHLELFYHLEISFGGCIGNGQGMTGTGNQVCANWAWGRPSIFKFEGMSGNITKSIGYRAHERTKPMRIDKSMRMGLILSVPWHVHG